MMKGIKQMVQKNRLKSASLSSTKKFICILIGFIDLAFTKTKEDFENLFNQATVDRGSLPSHSFYITSAVGPKRKHVLSSPVFVSIINSIQGKEYGKILPPFLLILRHELMDGSCQAPGNFVHPVRIHCGDQDRKNFHPAVIMLDEEQ